MSRKTFWLKNDKLDDFIAFYCIFLIQLIKFSICMLPKSYHQSGGIISYLLHVLSKFKVGNETYCLLAACNMKIRICYCLNVLYPIEKQQILLESLLTSIRSICTMCNFKYIHRSNRFRQIKCLKSCYCIITCKMRIRVCYCLNVLYPIEQQQILLESLLTSIRSICTMCNFKYIHRSNRFR